MLKVPALLFFHAVCLGREPQPRPFQVLGVVDDEVPRPIAAYAGAPNTGPHASGTSQAPGADDAKIGGRISPPFGLARQPAPLCLTQARTSQWTWGAVP